MNYTLKDINEQIKGLATINIAEATNGINLLLAELMRSDEFYILSAYAVSQEQLDSKTFAPYIAPTLNSELQFLRLFSHKEAAELFLSKLDGQHSVCKINTTETVLLAKHCLLVGISGFILNDGQIWTTLSFEQYLTIFFNDILKAPEKMDADYVPAATFVSSLLSSNSFLYKKTKNDLTIFDKEEKIKGNELSVDVLLSLVKKNTTIDVKYQSHGADIIFSMPAFKIGFIIEEIKTAKSLFSLDENNSFCKFNELDPYLVFEKTMPEATEENDGEVLPESAPSLHTAPSSRRPIILPRIKMSEKISVKRILVISGSLVVIIAAVIGLIYWNLISHIAEFERDINSNSFSAAIEIHERYGDNNVFIARTSQCITDKIDTLLIKYVSGELSEKELLDNYETLGSLGYKKELDVAYKQFYLVQNSRTSYANGNNSIQSIMRLYFWKNVVKSDKDNFNDVQAQFKENSDAYLTSTLNTLDTLIKYQQAEDVYRTIDVLDYWYPNNDYVLKVKNRVMSMGLKYNTTQPISDTSMFATNDLPDNNSILDVTPVKISRIDVQYSAVSDCMDLYITWTNTSAKIIREVDFYVLPTTDMGEYATTTDSYQMYCARDVGPYVINKGTPSDNWAWKNAWTGNEVFSASLSQIIIIYQDGSILSIDNDVILENIIA